MKHLKSYNESIRDKMTPVSDDDIRNKMGEEKYHIYKAVQDAKDSIKEPFELVKIQTGRSEDDLYIFGVQIWFLKFIISYDGGFWYYKVQYNSENVDIKYRNWIEVYEQMKSDANKYFNMEIDIIQTEISRHQNKIDNMNKDLKKVNELI